MTSFKGANRPLITLRSMMSPVDRSIEVSFDIFEVSFLARHSAKTAVRRRLRFSFSLSLITACAGSVFNLGKYQVSGFRYQVSET